MFKIKTIIIFFFTVTLYTQENFPKHFIVISKPGSGKGTFSNYMSKKYGYVHIGLGDLTRTRKDNHQSTTSKVLNKILKQHIQTTVKNKKQFILYNAIISKKNWESWEKFFKEIDIINDIYFIVLDAADETCLYRIKDRLICSKCYNVTKKRNDISISEHYCKDCGIRLTIRKSDCDQQFLQQRFEKYHRVIEPIIKKLEKAYKVIHIASEQPLQNLYTIYDQLHTI